MKIGTKVIAKDGVYHLMSRTNLGGKEGEVVSVSCDGTGRIKVKFPPGTLGNTHLCRRFAVTLDMTQDSVIIADMLPHYESGLAKLTHDERKALGV